MTAPMSAEFVETQAAHGSRPWRAAATAPAPSRRRPVPELAPEALYGLAGEWWNLIEPHTEASAPGVIAQFLVAAGNTFGRSPYMAVGFGEHHRANENCLLVGDSGVGAKGTSLKMGLLPFEHADRAWWDTCIHHAANSSLGVIDLVRDRREDTDPEDGRTMIVDEGCLDPMQRGLFRLSEFASLVKKFDVKGDTLSQTYRDAWDGTKLANTSKTNRCSATHYHLSLVGHVTRAELLKCLDATEMVNGFLNRHLLIWSERSKVLASATAPDGADLQLFYATLRERIEAAKQVGEVRRDGDAQALYAHLVTELVTVPRGVLGALLERGRQHVLRLAMVYALLDDTADVGVPHLLAALAVWDYSAATYVHVFGGATGTPKADRFMELLVAAGGRILHSDLHNALGRNWTTADYDAVVEDLVHGRRIRVEEEHVGGRGRPGKVYVALRPRAVEPILPQALAFLGRQA